MSSSFTRREFLSDAAMTGVASVLKLDPHRHKRHPAAAPLERRASFDRDWKFTLGDPQNAQTPHFDDRAWRTLDVPHDWTIEGPFSPDALAKGNGGYLPTGIGWYRKAFTLPPSAAGRLVAIEFDGIYQRSEVWINGVSLGMRPYGFISFAYDLTPHLLHGRSNVLAVRVDNSLQPNCRWYSGSGIYRHTWLRITNPIHIAQWGLCVRTPSVTAQSATVEAATRIFNETPRSADLDLLTEILDASGSVLQQSRSHQHVVANSTATFAETLALPSPKLWSPSAPQLHQARVTILLNNTPIDSETTTFGIREARFDVDRGLLVNGEHIKMNGVCIHGDGGSVGSAVPERVWERRLELLREMGCNAIRLSHNPPAPELLDMLDRMGFLVMDEAFDEWKQPKGQTPLYGYHKYFDEWSERDLTAMIERDRNHPSIVIWSAGNEVPDQTDPQGPATLQRLKDIIHRSDPTRPITVACDQIAAEPKSALPAFLEKLDVVGYNYVDRWRDRREKYYSIDRHDYPDRRFVGTESVALYGARGVYTPGPTLQRFFGHASNTEIEVEQLQKFIQTYDYVSGDFIWTGIDYIGESFWPNKLAPTGPLDTCGFKKDNFYFYQSLWTDTPVLHLSPHWNWPGKEGQVVSVNCFTNCDTVELFLNGKSLGAKGFAFPRPGMIKTYGHYPPRARALQTTADLHLTWDVPYAPGKLRAEGTKDDRVIQIVEVQTTGAPNKLELLADRAKITTAPGDVAHITVRVLDANGLVVPTADNPITFDLEGAGRILGVDNGRPDSHEPYKASRRDAFNGLALVLLQSTGRPSSITLSARSPSLAPASIQVTAT
ncbi:MAG TPA: glycoside hydrolase family 2 TIM barrel-domain containing protein [Acidobacteriaceae bacterium]|jgi:beta-galactosidase|nr:glycoside hydrolase family 2 TIM barrel-domain containing protein [Acidobacteriaceae bacterium]